MIGGTSWRSTIEYYATINRLINDRHGGNVNPPLRIVSLNQRQIHDLQHADDWDGIAQIFVSAALDLQGLGADGIALCASTPHKVYDQICHSLSIPVLHIADAIGVTLERDGLDTAGLLGTRFTMSQEFIKGRLSDRYQVRTIVPPSDDQNRIQDMIYDELSVGTFEDSTRKFFLEVIDSLQRRGAQAAILGCTEFPLLLKDADCPIPPVDSLTSHCEAIARFILDEECPERSLMK